MLKRGMLILVLAIVSLSAAGQTVVRVNGGGPAYTDSLAQKWLADTGFNNGGGVANSNTVTGTPDPALYQTAHWCNTAAPFTTFTSLVDNGNYTVKLKFDENNRTGAGQRLFNVLINGTQVETNLDIFALAGGQFKALDRTYTVNVTAGKIVVTFVPVVFNPRVGAIEITRIVVAPPPPPTAVATLLVDASRLPANLLVPLSGIGAMASNDLPARNPDGTLNQARQDAAVVSIVNAAVTAGLLPAPTSAFPLADLQNFALFYAHANNLYGDVRPKTTLITWIQVFLGQDLNADGSVNWSSCTTKCIDQDVADLVSLALDPALGNWKLAGVATQQQVTSFALDLARIVDTYNKS